MSLDREKPLETCESESCDDCAIHDRVHCHFSLKDWLYFLLISFPSFILGSVGIYHLNGWLMIPWVIIIITFFGFIEIRVMCSHCINFACPLNRVDKKTRGQFFDKNPAVAEAWK